MSRGTPIHAGRWFTAWVAASFTGVVAASLVFTVQRIDEEAREKGLAEARAIHDLNLAYRRWAAGHGGVYVRVTPEVRPNPHLSMHPDRDLKTVDGWELTLVNPAMMTRSVHEILAKSAPVPLLNRVTSLRPVNPQNEPDAWEAEALRSFEAGATEASEAVWIGGEPYLRLIRPYFTERGCLVCHAAQGYAQGDVRGGLSVGVAMRPYLAIAAAERRAAYLSHLVIWAIGLGGIFLLGRRIRRDERRLVDSEWKFRTLAESSPDLEYWSRTDGSLTFMSPSAEAITGHPAEAFERDPGLLERIVHPEDRPRWTAHLSDVSAACAADLLFRIIRPDGAVRWLSHSCAPIVRQGRSMGRRVSNRDVSDLVAARGSLQRWAHIFEHAEWGVAVGSGDGSVLEELNPAFARMHGFTVEELRGRSPSILFPPEVRPELSGQMAAAERTGHHTWETVHLRKDGSRFPVECDITVVRDGDRILYRVINAHDVSDRHRIEAQLRQAQKMEAVGQLAGGVAHDFNNVLSVIVSHAALLEEESPGPGPVRDHARDILGAGERARNLTKSLLAFSRTHPADLDLRPVDLNAIVRGFRGMLARLIGEDVALRTELAEAELVVDADAGQIEQALLNLATNARDAMPRGGVLTIATSGVTIEADPPAPTVARPGRYALLSVSDDGVGMSRDVLEHVFEPFFTTKPVGRGSGLGLSIVYGVVNRHGGRITVYSEPGQGTVFKIYLPLSARRPRTEEATTSPIVGGTETLLLVEDEAAVRKATRMTLERHGYAVVEAEDGQGALAALRAAPERFALVLCDLVMPGMSGVETAAALRALREDLPVVFMSGYTRDLIAQKGLDEATLHFVAKPILPRELLAKLREVLDG